MVSASASEEKVKLVMVPVPVPVFVPVPMNMYSQHTPAPVPMPIPVPVPIVVPPRVKEMKDAAVQFQIHQDDEKQENELTEEKDQSRASSHPREVKSEPVAPSLMEVKEEPTAEPEPPQSRCSWRRTKSQDSQPETSTKSLPPPAPMIDLEADFPTDPLDQKSPPHQRGVKRPREGSYSRRRGRRRTVSTELSAPASPPTCKLNYLYGVKAWRSWVQQANQQPKAANRLDVKEDIIECNSASLSVALTRFIREVRRPNGEQYSPDSIFCLCLGIQEYLFMKGRMENIFTDELYRRFSSEISEMLHLWKPKLQPNGSIVPSRLEESYLWECKQLGAYSPIVLLNTLLFFFTKNFQLTTLEQHQQLTFFSLKRGSRPSGKDSKVSYLQYEGGGKELEQTENSIRCQEENVVSLEILENLADPLQCPVRLYEFYLSRCPESVKKRTNQFYLQPQRNVHMHSSHWYTSQPLEGATLQNMLRRILVVREVQQRHQCQAAAEGAAE